MNAVHILKQSKNDYTTVTTLTSLPLEYFISNDFSQFPEVVQKYAQIIKEQGNVELLIEHHQHNYLIPYYAYLRVIPFDQCLEFYQKEGVLESHKGLIYLPTVIMMLGFSASFLLHHNTYDDYYHFEGPSFNDLLRKFHPEPTMIDETRDYETPHLLTPLAKVSHWLDAIPDDSAEMKYILTWIMHSTDSDAPKLREMMEHLPSEINELYFQIPARVKFGKVVNWVK